MSPQEFAQRIKEKNPHLQGVDDMQLVKNILENYPEYRDDVDMTEDIPDVPVTEAYKSAFEPQKELSGMEKVGEYGKGLLKGAASTIKGMSEFGERIIGAPTRAITGEKFQSSAGQLQSMAESSLDMEEGSLTEGTNKYQRAGKTTEQIAEFVLPALKVAKVTSGANLATKLGSRALTSGTVATMQEGKIGKETGIAAGAELLIPAGGAILKAPMAVMSRLLKGVGSAISGVAVPVIEKLTANAKTVIDASKKIVEQGKGSILRENAQTILNGISKIRQSARGSYGKALEKLSAIDINPNVIRESLNSVFEKNGIKIGRGGFDLSGTEIFDKTIKDKLQTLLNSLNDLTNVDGKRLKAIIDKFESSRFKSTGGDPNRLAFNAVLGDIKTGLRDAIGKSTKKLETANKKFSEEMQLAESVERIFGKVKFKSTKEIDKIADKLEKLFQLPGLGEDTVLKFLGKIGVDTEKFYAKEATRQIYAQELGKNTMGLRLGELLQAFTSAVVTPVTIKNLAVATGLAEELLRSIAKYTNPATRATIIKSLIDANKE